MSEAGLDPKGAIGKTKPQLHLIPKVSLEAQAAALDHGKKKYGERNWVQAKVCTNTYIAAIMRHTSSIREGEDIDPESGIPHLGHITASCAILLDAEKAGTLVDDRVTVKSITESTTPHDA